MVTATRKMTTSSDVICSMNSINRRERDNNNDTNNDDENLVVFYSPVQKRLRLQKNHPTHPKITTTITHDDDDDDDSSSNSDCVKNRRKDAFVVLQMTRRKVVEENEDVFGCILSFLDVIALIEKKVVCQRWKRLCTIVIDRKVFCSGTKMKIYDKRELKHAVNIYIDTKHSPENAEEIAKTYGWPMNRWDVSQITDFSWVFGAVALQKDNRKHDFNETIGMWDVSNALDMSYMFYGASSFNRDLSNWDTGHVQNMSLMFAGASSFTGVGLSSWNVSRVEDMSHMFYGASSFAATNLFDWNVCRVRKMSAIFRGSVLSNQQQRLLLQTWNTTNVVEYFMDENEEENY